MLKAEVATLIQEVKAAYPNWKADETGVDEMVQVWHNVFQYIPYPIARRALYKHLESEDGKYIPHVGQLKKLAKALLPTETTGTWSSMIMDRRHQSIRWQPDPNGSVYEIPNRFIGDTAKQEGLWEDEEGRLYAFADGHM